MCIVKTLLTLPVLFSRLLITFANRMDRDQGRQKGGGGGRKIISEEYIATFDAPNLDPSMRVCVGMVWGCPVIDDC